jgi:hypothetical protein
VKENPNLTDHIYEAAARMREAHLNRTPAERTPQSRTYDLGVLGSVWMAFEPQLHTWADHVAWERLQREALLHTVWTWIAEAHETGSADTGDLIDALNRMGASCPPELNTES